VSRVDIYIEILKNDECGQKQFMQRWTQKYGGDGFPTDSLVSKHQLFGQRSPYSWF